MADMGFLPAVRRLLDATRKDRQTLLFSATLDGEVDVLVKRYQHQPRRHEVVGDDADRGDVHHVFWKAPTAAPRGADRRGGRRPRPGHRVLPDPPRRRPSGQAPRHQAGVSAAPIHGGRSQPQRDRALAAFKGGAVQALVATDVAARGIHVDAVACVVHYDLPADSKDYVHRSGRTGRAGADGVVVSMVGPDQAKEVRTLQRQLGYSQELIAPDPSALPASAPFVPQVAVVEARRPQAEQRRPGANSGAGNRRRASTGSGRPHRGASSGGGHAHGGGGRPSGAQSSGRFRTDRDGPVGRRGASSR